MCLELEAKLNCDENHRLKALWRILIRASVIYCVFIVEVVLDCPGRECWGLLGPIGDRMCALSASSASSNAKLSGTGLIN